MCCENNRPRRSRVVFICGAASAALLAFGYTTAPSAPPDAGQLKKHVFFLTRVHAEVKEMGPYPGEDFIRREFFVGEDDDDTNKDIHVTVLIQALNSKEMMTVQVTEMTKDPGNPRARLAGNSKTVSCLVAGGRLEVLSSDYEEKELANLASEILKAVQNKKKLLKVSLCENGRPG